MNFKLLLFISLTIHLLAVAALAYFAPAPDFKALDPSADNSNYPKPVQVQVITAQLQWSAEPLTQTEQPEPVEETAEELSLIHI